MTSRRLTATYRLQVQPGFGFDQIGEIADYLHALGVSHVYLSPVLQPTPGSTHGYDVVDHSRLNEAAGGRPAFDRMSGALQQLGLSAVADVVPNHMAVPTPVKLNHALWSVLRDGPNSPFARWFDVDWSVDDRAVLMPVLGERIGRILASGGLSVHQFSDDEWVLRYADHEFPVRPGTEHLRLEELVDRQWYRLAWWRIADEELNYRRFFDVDTLAAVRVEDPPVFDATHALLLELLAEGQLDGLRIDHPDGLADPRGYLRRLAEVTDGCWVVVEKILEGDEELPADWPCAGTTGYDALRQIGGLFVDPAAAAPLADLLTEMTGENLDFAGVIESAKRQVIEESLYTEVHRLVDLLVAICRDDIALRDHPRRHLRACVVELLVAFDTYRAYVVPGEPAPAESVRCLDRAVAVARGRMAQEAHDALELVRDLALDRPVGSRPTHDVERRAAFVVRFQQTCGPVMAKGVEDTAFYRWHRLIALNEVGGDPTEVGVAPERFHAYATGLQRDWPATMTTLSTHDTKRSEDVRARLYALSESPAAWAEAVRGWTEAASRHRTPEGWPDPATLQLIWQTLVGGWGTNGPLSLDRLGGYLTKATREAKRFTSWTRPEAAYDDAVQAFAAAVLADTELLESIRQFSAGLDGAARGALLGQKLVQLMMPGIPDVYQGCELVELSLVDPDNRRPVDFSSRRLRLAKLDAGEKPRDLDDEKLLVSSRALRLRRSNPEWFVGAEATYTPVPTSSGNAFAFGRGSTPSGVQPSGVQVVVVATRLPVSLAHLGGWGDHTLALPPGPWIDELTGREFAGGMVALGRLLEELPVALLVRG